ncbi:MAG: NADH-quinone oxidoreductase subunit NuoF [bacterium]|jgi:NADH:ubiquinone oxidoreductase subunit F (NADH-binding)/(2Fe-2S) ferredoxin/Pyruvate/2-oxoacid:ferredoxin oxidoreductase delta subunit
MKSLAELAEYREKVKAECNLRQDKSDDTRVLVGYATCGIAAGATPVLDAFIEEVGKRRLPKVMVTQTGCIGICKLEPVVEILEPGKEKVTYVELTPDKVEKIVTEHLQNGRVVDEYTIGAHEEGIQSLNDSKFYKKQRRVALRNSGIINPESIDEYIARDGYEALGRVLTSMQPEDVIATIKNSGLRGRGGAGFPTGLKWQFAAASPGPVKYVCCNADEGDPGAFMDRSVLEGDPHALLEAMTIAGYAIGAHQGYIYVRAEYPTAIKRLQIAIDQAHKYGFLGKNIFNTGFDFDLELRLGSGAFVCGEETALMISIEGKRGEPRPRPPFPAVKGLFDKPTILNNVETYANIPRIILNGADWFSAVGTEKSKGTKVFCLVGKINNTGLVEIPMGTTLREVIEEIGGGIQGGKKFKAAQTGGPSGGCIPASLIDTPIDYDNLVAIGAMMGSGGLIVMDEDTCMVDIAKFFLEFTAEESCGKCTPCRIGTKRLLEMLEKITRGEGTLELLDDMEELCNGIKNNSLCALGQTAPNPVLSTLRYFRDEYVAHVVDKKCPAGVCRDLLSYEIDADKCIGCTACARACPAGAISGKVKEKHVIDKAKCIKCGACLEACKFGAVAKK